MASEAQTPTTTAAPAAATTEGSPVATGEPAGATAVPAQTTVTLSEAVKTAPRARRARLVLSRIDPWSVMKLAFMLALAVAIASVIALMVVWGVLAAAGVFEQLNAVVGRLSGDAVNISAYLSFGRWLGFGTLIGVVNVVLMTALATLSAFLYNIATSLVGGVQVTLSEDI